MEAKIAQLRKEISECKKKIAYLTSGNYNEVREAMGDLVTKKTNLELELSAVLAELNRENERKQEAENE